MIKYLFLTTLLISKIIYAQSNFQVKADFLCSQIIENPNFKYEDYFSSVFISKIKYSDIVSILKSIYKEDGACVKATLKAIDQSSVKVETKEKSTSFKFVMSLDNKNMIAGLRYKGRVTPKIKISSSKELKAELAKIDGVKSVYLTRFKSHKALIDIQSKSKMALGSEFKLYVLNYLSTKILNNELKWTDDITIQEKFKSLPGGKLQNEVDGKKISIKDVASLMISISDNTATDHLIGLLGSENILKSIKNLNSFYSLNDPFMTTMDLFRIRTLNLSEMNSYLKLSVQDKKKYLENLALNLDRKKTSTLLEKWESPKDIETAEWFASTQDICHVIEKLNSQSAKDDSIRKILAINVPFLEVDDNPYFDYLGYKGGSEPGVLTMTFLLKSKNNKWGCLSVAYNNTKNALNEIEVADLTHAILRYSGILLNR